MSMVGEVYRQHSDWKSARLRIENAPRKFSVQNPVYVSHKSAPEYERDWTGEDFKQWRGVIVAEIKIGQICDVVRKKFDVSREDFESDRHYKSFVKARQCAMCLSKHLTRKSLPEIGRRIARRDHTTVLHALRRWVTVMGKVSAIVPVGSPIEAWVNAFHAEMLVTPPDRRQKP